MTGTEIEQLKAMWSSGLPTKAIAQHLCFSHSTIRRFVHENRELFPYRNRIVSDETRQLWTRQMREGKATPRKVSKTLGVSYSTAYKWMMAR